METYQKLISEMEELRSIIDNNMISTVFQPIVSLKNGEILGYEALSRCTGNIFTNPAAMFEAARKYNMLWDLEYLCRLTALKSYAGQKKDKLLFINVDPHIVNDEKFRKGFTLEFLKEYGLRPEHTVLEITENSYVEDSDLFHDAVKTYKDQLYNIAIDDTGSGYSGLNLITDIQPKYVKLDINLIRGIDSSKLKSSLVHALTGFASDCSISLIAEGVETKEELKTLIELGVDYAQGFFLARPGAVLPSLDASTLSLIRAYNANNHQRRLFTFPAGIISKSEVTLDISDKGAKADELFKANKDIYGIAVLNDGTVEGLLSRSSFYYQLGTKFGYDLFLNRSVSIVMDKNPLIVDYYTDIDDVCTAAMQRSVDKLYNSIVVIKNGRYYGMLSVKNILEKVSELKVETARHLNPLTYLPGNVIIENRLTQMLNRLDDETILYIDVDNFKAYNDYYGTLKGDRFLSFVADCITGAAAEYGREQDIFIGHIGGDDYIVIAKSDIAYELGHKIIQIFESKKSNLYCDEALKNQGLKIRNRSGNVEFFPLATLSIAGVQCSGNTCTSIYILTEHAAVVKKQCKNVRGNAVIIQELGNISHESLD